ncbi:hypothetical protein ACLI1A_16270 [Flavobacterium sp. RHBU_3]|uniref:hypothetical protein n=1 Tax=Flavobacterium sp. RHBU_3 TaxID=3391184 RepID=UPI0039849903
MKKEQWIDDILSSTNSLKKLHPDENLLRQIKEKAATNEVNYKMLWFVAASVILLVSLNLRALGNVNTVQKPVNESQADNPFSESNQLY